MKTLLLTFVAMFAVACGGVDPESDAAPALPSQALHTAASGGGGGGGVKVDSIKVSKCYCNGSEMLIKAASSDPAARLFAYRPDGTYQGEVQNGGGSRYGGTVMGFVPFDPGSMTIKSSSGGSVTVPTTPFQL
jgi:hypothetical protein